MCVVLRKINLMSISDLSPKTSGGLVNGGWSNSMKILVHDGTTNGGKSELVDIENICFLIIPILACAILPFWK